MGKVFAHWADILIFVHKQTIKIFQENKPPQLIKIEKSYNLVMLLIRQRL